MACQSNKIDLDFFLSTGMLFLLAMQTFLIIGYEPLSAQKKYLLLIQANYIFILANGLTFQLLQIILALNFFQF